MTSIDDMIKDRWNALMRSWPAFVKGASPFMIGNIVDRSQTVLPKDDFCPWAPAVIVPGNYLLNAAKRSISGWSSRPTFRKLVFGNRLAVCRIGDLYSVERENFSVLAFPFGPLPIFTRSARQAMQLAEYCHPRPMEGEGPFPQPRGAASGLRWVPAEPGGILYV